MKNERKKEDYFLLRLFFCVKTSSDAVAAITKEISTIHVGNSGIGEIVGSGEDEVSLEADGDGEPV